MAKQLLAHTFDAPLGGSNPMNSIPMKCNANSLLLHSHPTPCHRMPSRPMPYYPMLTQAISSYPKPSRGISCHPIPSYPILSLRISSYLVVSHRIPSHLISSRPVSSRSIDCYSNCCCNLPIQHPDPKSLKILPSTFTLPIPACN